VGATLGILDSTDYLDANEYANDEYTQFMNEAFVNSGSYGLPSYDTGAVIEWAAGPWSVNALGMNIEENTPVTITTSGVSRRDTRLIPD